MKQECQVRKTAITLTLNGETRTVDVEPSDILLDVLIWGVYPLLGIV